MLLHKEKIFDSIELSTVSTNKFKASVISFSMTLPLKRSSTAYGLLISHLLCRGSASYPSIALLNRRLDELYGSYVEIKSHHIGENLSLTISAETLDNKYIPDGTDVIGELISIIAELILSPAFLQPSFSAQVFEQEKRLIVDSINAEINNPRLYSAKKCLELMQEDIALPTSDELKQIVSDISYGDLCDYYRELISSAPLRVFCVSAENAENLKRRIEASFEGYPCKSPSLPIPLRPLKRNLPEHKKVSMPVSQGKLTLGFSTDIIIRSDDDTYYTMIMLNEILGGSASSKLFLNVREKMGLCYYCSSSYSLYSGIMLISSGFEMKNYEIAKEAILNQIEEIKNGNVSDFELESAQRSVTSGYRQLYDSPFELQSFFLNRALFNIPDGIDDAERKLLAVKKDDIIALAKKIRLDASFFIEGDADACEGESYCE
jgi:predicted Zn-dependent peptidase